MIEKTEIAELSEMIHTLVAGDYDLSDADEAFLSAMEDDSPATWGPEDVTRVWKIWERVFP